MQATVPVAATAAKSANKGANNGAVNGAFEVGSCQGRVASSARCVLAALGARVVKRAKARFCALAPITAPLSARGYTIQPDDATSSGGRMLSISGL